MEQVSDGKNYVFVYGTLRKGFGNHYLLTDSDSKEIYFINEAITKEKYSMYVMGNIPFVNKNISETHIFGELYLVNDQILQRLDMLESHPNWYIREKIQVVITNGNEFSAWIYFNNVTTPQVVKSGDFRQYIIEQRG